MRKVILANLVSVDGYFEGPNKELDWFNVDSEFLEQAEETLNFADILLFGRITYEHMASYWPTAEAIKNDPIIAKKMNSLSKIVFSKTLEKAKWENTKLVKENIIGEILILKQQPGKDIVIFGSSDLSVYLMQADLIDEFRIFINPVALGGGNTLFKSINKRYNLKLLNVKTFKSGNVLLCYGKA